MRTGRDRAAGFLPLKGVVECTHLAVDEIDAGLDADASSPEWERMVCLGELASLGKPGEGRDAS